MSSTFSKVLAFSKKYPLSRGMASYAVIWPVGSLVQQTIVGEEEYNFARVARFCLYGSCYVAPTLFFWIKIANKFWPLSTLKSAMTKAVVEQFTYTPFAMVSFYFGMTLLEGKSVEDAKKEVEDKFIPTYKVGALVWPVLQTFNYTVIKERNRVVFVSFCSLIWTSFLAYMKHLEADQLAAGFSAKEGEPVNPGPVVRHKSSETTRDSTWIVKQQLER